MGKKQTTSCLLTLRQGAHLDDISQLTALALALKCFSTWILLACAGTAFPCPRFLSPPWSQLNRNHLDRARPPSPRICKGPVSPGGRGGKYQLGGSGRWGSSSRLTAEPSGTCAGLTLHVCVSLPRADPSSPQPGSVAKTPARGSRVCPSHFSTALRKPV